MVEITCIVDAKARVAEGPVWDEQASVLWWTNIYGQTLNRYDPATGVNQAFDVGEPLGSFALRAAGGVLLACKSGFYTFDPATRQKTLVVDPEPDRPNHRLNDGRCDRAGRFWCGSMPDPILDRPTGALHRLDPDGTTRPMVKGALISNGLAFSPDNRTLYFADSWTAVRTVWAFDFDLTSGTLGTRRVFIDTRDLPGRPDGAAVDADGCYWMTCTGGGSLMRFTPDGRLDRTVPLPVKRPTMVAFGGKSLDTLYLTTLRSPDDHLPEAAQDGGLFRIDGLGVTGLVEPRFAG
ncbi:MAG: SMP-30/gluconolactonase/LRE family protein [Alphaproteobacteria bacterium]|nr:SMP-30/gluconolactonase/LRE family protein [Alphaproteobacteria bacterium]